METTILELITTYGLNTVIIATLIFIITGLIKMPIKALAQKLSKGKAITRFITLLPVIFGFCLTALYKYIVTKSVVLDGSFITLWLTSSSLSLAIYAITEKFIPTKKKILEEYEIKQNEELIGILKEKLTPQSAEQKLEEHEKTQEQQPMQKIILRGNGNGETVDVKEQQL